MLVEFDKLPDTSKIWIYQSNRKFYKEEISQIIEKVEGFLSSWNDNGIDLIASYRFVYDRFIIFGVDETLDKISIDAIDSSVGLILHLQEEFGVELLDKLNVSFKQGEYIQYKDLKEFQKLVKKKAVSDKTIVFNNLINIKEELENNWEIPITRKLA